MHYPFLYQKKEVESKLEELFLEIEIPQEYYIKPEIDNEENNSNIIIIQL